VGIEPALVEGEGGILEISVDGRVVWTNDERRGYVPPPEEILPSVREAI